MRTLVSTGDSYGPCRGSSRAPALELEELAQHRLALVAPDLHEPALLQDAARGGVPGGRRRPDRPHAGVGEGPLHRDPRPLGGVALLLRVLLDTVRHLDHAVLAG